MNVQKGALPRLFILIRSVNEQIQVLLMKPVKTSSEPNSFLIVLCCRISFLTFLNVAACDLIGRCAAVCPGGVETHFAIGDGRSAGSAAMQGAFRPSLNAFDLVISISQDSLLLRMWLKPWSSLPFLAFAAAS